MPGMFIKIDTSNKITVLFIASCLGRFTFRALEKTESKKLVEFNKDERQKFHLKQSLLSLKQAITLQRILSFLS